MPTPKLSIFVKIWYCVKQKRNEKKLFRVFQQLLIEQSNKRPGVIDLGVVVTTQDKIFCCTV